MSNALPQGPVHERPPPVPAGGDPGSDERREHVRRMLRVPACLDAPDAHNPIQLIDICRAGVAFASKPPLALGARFRLSFELPTAPGIVNTVGGEVVYCKLMPTSNLHKVGARLQAMDGEIVERIVDFVTAPVLP